jgi:hypothetical protein
MCLPARLEGNPVDPLAARIPSLEGGDLSRIDAGVELRRAALVVGLAVGYGCVAGIVCSLNAGAEDAQRQIEADPARGPTILGALMVDIPAGVRLHLELLLTREDTGLAGFAGRAGTGTI